MVPSPSLPNHGPRSASCWLSQHNTGWNRCWQQCLAAPPELSPRRLSASRGSQGGQEPDCLAVAVGSPRSPRNWGHSTGTALGKRSGVSPAPWTPPPLEPLPTGPPCSALPGSALQPRGAPSGLHPGQRAGDPQPGEVVSAMALPWSSLETPTAPQALQPSEAAFLGVHLHLPDAPAGSAHRHRVQSWARAYRGWGQQPGSP